MLCMYLTTVYVLYVYMGTCTQNYVRVPIVYNKCKYKLEESAAYSIVKYIF